MWQLALSGLVEEREALARERLAASLLGEDGVEGGVGSTNRHRARPMRGFHRARDAVPPAQRDSTPGRRRLPARRFSCRVRGIVAFRSGVLGPRPVFPCRSALVGLQEIATKSGVTARSVQRSIQHALKARSGRRKTRWAPQLELPRLWWTPGRHARCRGTIRRPCTACRGRRPPAAPRLRQRRGGSARRAGAASGRLAGRSGVLQAVIDHRDAMNGSNGQNGHRSA